MNPITAYIKKIQKQRRPDDTTYALAKRCNITNSTLQNTFKAPNAWQQCVYLMRICSDLNISMEEAILQSPIPADKKYADLEKRYNSLLFDYSKLKNDYKNLKKSLADLSK